MTKIPEIGDVVVWANPNARGDWVDGDDDGPFVIVAINNKNDTIVSVRSLSTGKILRGSEQRYTHQAFREDEFMTAVHRRRHE